MTPQQPKLQPDGTVFPPVTPDVPPVPGVEQVEIPDGPLPVPDEEQPETD